MISMGFVIERVDVMGEGRLHEADVRKALGVYAGDYLFGCLLYTSPSPRDATLSRMPSSA